MASAGESSRNPWLVFTEEDITWECRSASVDSQGAVFDGLGLSRLDVPNWNLSIGPSGSRNIPEIELEIVKSRSFPVIISVIFQQIVRRIINEPSLITEFKVEGTSMLLIAGKAVARPDKILTIVHLEGAGFDRDSSPVAEELNLSGTTS